MKIEGKVERIIFRNEENNYTVFLLKADDNGAVYTVVGNTPPFVVGDLLDCTVEEKENPKYGLQYQLLELEIKLPKNDDNIIKYLSSGLFPGLGPVTAERIVKKFGQSTFEVMEHTPHFLSLIKGVSKKSADKIHKRFMELKSANDLYVYFASLSVSLNFAHKLIKKYGVNAKQVVQNNPYVLIEDIQRVGFMTADRIAISAGMPFDDLKRIKAGIEYAFKNSCSVLGHTYMYSQALFKAAYKILSNDEMKLTFELFTHAVHELIAEDRLKAVEHEENVVYMLPLYYFTEIKIAKKLQEIATNFRPVYVDTDKEIDNYQKENDIVFHSGQRNAIKNALSNGVSIITGGPGTGKTTIVKCIVHLFEIMGKTVALTSPTGRAAKRLEESSGYTAKTIHRLLDVQFNDAEGFFFAYNTINKLPYDIIIVDEISMCDESLFCKLLNAVERGTSLILVGDKDQLPSVGEGNVLFDIIESGVIPVSYLTYIYRQSKHSFISHNAHLINEGKMIEIQNDKEDDFFFAETKTHSETLQEIYSLLSGRILKAKNFEPKDIQVLCQMKKGECGSTKLNEGIREILNPRSPKKSELKWGHNNFFREGDRVIHTINDYELEWVIYEDKDVKDSGKGIFNGEIGYISEINKDRTMLVVFDDNKYALYKDKNINELELAYAISIHKAQGSEFPAVLIPIVNGPGILCNRKIIYTGLTRAKKMAIMLGDKKHLNRMIKSVYTLSRNTFLKLRLQEAFRGVN